jgi:hypothetical protein
MLGYATFISAHDGSRIGPEGEYMVPEPLGQLLVAHGVADFVVPTP